MKRFSKKKIQIISFLLLGAVVVTVLTTISLNWGSIVKWYEFHQEFESLGFNQQGLPEYRHRQTEIVFVKVPSGTVIMGNNEPSSNSSPQFTAKLKSFLIAKYEVSQTQWKKIMGDNPSHFKGPNLPVEQMSWKDCQQFCEKTGLNLPWETQWEYACRAGTQSNYSFGDKVTSEMANFGENWSSSLKNGMTSPIDSFKPNPWGIHNMHGNVSEYCRNANVWPAHLGKNTDLYKHPDFENFTRMVRGGHWMSQASELKSGYRSEMLYWHKYSHIGFRPIKELKDE